jgi:hypothetical protein
MGIEGNCGQTLSELFRPPPAVVERQEYFLALAWGFARRAGWRRDDVQCAPEGQAAWYCGDDADLDFVPRPNVKEAIVPDSGHWIMEENPAATTRLVLDFLQSERMGKDRPYTQPVSGSQVIAFGIASIQEARGELWRMIRKVTKNKANAIRRADL